MCCNIGLQRVAAQGESDGTTLKKIGSVVPGEVCCEILTVGVDSVLSVECLAVGIEHDLVFSRDFHADTVVSITIRRMKIENP